MNPRSWNIIVIALTVLLAATAAILDYERNFFGVFGDVKGQRYLVYDNERTTKYLFGYNYIPSNFDGILIGSSISRNWNTGEITGVRMYNLSMDGANISEESLIVDQVLHRRHPKIAIILIFPYLTETSGRKSGFMNTQEYWGALGSVQLLRAYGHKWLIDHGKVREDFNEFGARDDEPPHGQPNLQAHAEFVIDPGALNDYSDVLARLRSSGTKIVGVIPPTEIEHWNLDRGAYLAYYSRVLPMFHADEPVINLQTDLEIVVKDKSNFVDGYHLSNAAAQEVVHAINARLHQDGLLQ